MIEQRVYEVIFWGGGTIPLYRVCVADFDEATARERATSAFQRHGGDLAFVHRVEIRTGPAGPANDNG